MDAAIRARFSERTLASLLAAWGCEPAAAQFLQDSFNLVYRLPAGVPGVAGAAYLRISHSSRRPAAQVVAELDWLAFLQARGLPVCRPLLPPGGDAVAQVADGDGAFIGALFAEVPGAPVDRTGWQEALFRRLGGLLARLHVASRAYDPPAGRRRAHWYADDRLLLQQHGLAAPADARARALFAVLYDTFRTWPTPAAAYGLIHSDVHAGNFHVLQGEIALFDFDDSCYHWFVADLANAIYYAVWHQARFETPGADPAAFAARFTRALLDGYAAVAPPPSALAQRLPLLIEYRDLLVYAYLRGRYGEQPPTAAMAALLEQRRRRFQQGRAYVALDWERLC